MRCTEVTGWLESRVQAISATGAAETCGPRSFYVAILAAMPNRLANLRRRFVKSAVSLMTDS